MRAYYSLSFRPAAAVVVLLTVSPVNGQPDGARGKQVFPIPLGPFVPHTTEGFVPHWLSEVHQGMAFLAGYDRLKTPS